MFVDCEPVERCQSLVACKSSLVCDNYESVLICIALNVNKLFVDCLTADSVIVRSFSTPSKASLSVLLNCALSHSDIYSALTVEFFQRCFRC